MTSRTPKLRKHTYKHENPHTTHFRLVWRGNKSEYEQFTEIEQGAVIDNDTMAIGFSIGNHVIELTFFGGELHDVSLIKYEGYGYE